MKSCPAIACKQFSKSMKMKFSQLRTCLQGITKQIFFRTLVSVWQGKMLISVILILYLIFIIFYLIGKLTAIIIICLCTINFKAKTTICLFLAGSFGKRNFRQRQILITWLICIGLPKWGWSMAWRCIIGCLCYRM